MVSLREPSDRPDPDGATRIPLAPGIPEDLARIVNAELRRLARRYLRRSGAPAPRTTSVVNEAWLRMQTGRRWSPAKVPDPAFASMVASVLRSLLVDEARHRLRRKRGGGWQRLPVDRAARLPGPREPLEELLDLDESLQTLEKVSPRRARVVELRYFGGLSVTEAAQALGVSERTVEDDWRVAKAWLRARLDGERAAEGAP